MTSFYSSPYSPRTAYYSMPPANLDAVIAAGCQVQTTQSPANLIPGSVWGQVLVTEAESMPPVSVVLSSQIAQPFVAMANQMAHQQYQQHQMQQQQQYRNF